MTTPQEPLPEWAWDERERVFQRNGIDVEREDVLAALNRASDADRVRELMSKLALYTCGDCDPCIHGRPDQCALMFAKESESKDEPCTHDELDHGICLYCGEDRDPNSDNYGKRQHCAASPATGEQRYSYEFDNMIGGSDDGKRPIPTPQPPAQGTATPLAIHEFCPICSDATRVNPDGVRVCDCQGIQPYALSCYPGEFCLVKAHPKNSGEQYYKRAEADAKFATAQRELAAALAQVESVKAERDEFQHELQKICDHEWTHIDDSFDHEFGTEQIHSYVCEKCGATKPYEPEVFWIRSDMSELLPMAEAIYEAHIAPIIKERDALRGEVEDMKAKAESYCQQLRALHIDHDETRADRDRLTADLAGSHKLLIQRAAELEQARKALDPALLEPIYKQLVSLSISHSHLVQHAWLDTMQAALSAARAKS